MDCLSMLMVKKYDEKVLTFLQKALKKMKLRTIRIKLDFDVSLKKVTEIFFNILKYLFELDIGVNKVSFYFNQEF